MMYERLLLIKDCLSDDASIYVHCDWRINSAMRMLLEELFGERNYINEIIWKRTPARGDAKQGARRFDIVHDCVFVYCCDIDVYHWNTQYTPFSDDQIEQQYNKRENGRAYRLVTPTAKKAGGDTSYEWMGVRPPQGRYWAYAKKKMQKMHDEGRLYYSSTGQPYIKYYLDERPGVSVQNDMD